PGNWNVPAPDETVVTPLPTSSTETPGSLCPTSVTRAAVVVCGAAPAADVAARSNSGRAGPVGGPGGGGPGGGTGRGWLSVRYSSEPTKPATTVPSGWPRVSSPAQNCSPAGSPVRRRKRS